MTNAPASYIGRSTTTGKFHIAHGSMVTDCNYSGQARRSSNRKAQLAEFEKASEAMFCKTCFPNGKPASFICE